jgi:predicted N-acetyltransferase YhbS/putative NADPH-quinone reductase
MGGSDDMKISLILGHPDKASFNHAVARATFETLRGNRHEVFFHDLYAEGFHPLLVKEEIPKGADVEPVIRMHCTEISLADGIVIVHPNWWGQPPAILKGWIDRVLRPGVAYEFEEGDGGEGMPRGLLRASTAIIFNTSNTPEEREKNVFGDPLEIIWKNCIFGLSGARIFYRKTFSLIVTSTPEQRAGWLREVGDIMNRYFPSLDKNIEIRIRSETNEDYARIADINDLAFGQKHEGVLVASLRKTRDFIPELSLVAEIRNDVVGHILFYPVMIRSGNREYKSLALAPMAVLPAYQRRGIGGRMVIEGLAMAKMLGHRSVIVLGHSGYYPRFGFQPAHRYHIRAPFDVPDDAYFAMELVEGELRDKAGVVIYPQEFTDV